MHSLLYMKSFHSWCLWSVKKSYLTRLVCLLCPSFLPFALLLEFDLLFCSLFFFEIFTRTLIFFHFCHFHTGFYILDALISLHELAVFLWDKISSTFPSFALFIMGIMAKYFSNHCLHSVAALMASVLIKSSHFFHWEHHQVSVWYSSTLSKTLNWFIV